MTHTLLRPLALASIVFAVTGCWGGISGSGELVTEARPATEFHAVRMEGFGTLAIAVGGASSVSVTADDNLIQYLKTEVAGGTLAITFTAPKGVSDTHITITVSTPTLDRIDVGGAAEVELTGATGPKLALGVEGAARLHATGAVDALEITIEGAAQARLFELHSREARVRIDGAGLADVDVKEKLRAEISGLGQVSYRGDPVVEKDINGIGRVTRDG